MSRLYSLTPIGGRACWQQYLTDLHCTPLAHPHAANSTSLTLPGATTPTPPCSPSPDAARPRHAASSTQPPIPRRPADQPCDQRLLTPLLAHPPTPPPPTFVLPRRRLDYSSFPLLQSCHRRCRLPNIIATSSCTRRRSRHERTSTPASFVHAAAGLLPSALVRRQHAHPSSSRSGPTVLPSILFLRPCSLSLSSFDAAASTDRLRDTARTLCRCMRDAGTVTSREHSAFAVTLYPGHACGQHCAQHTL